MIHALASFAIVAGLMTITPGIDTALVLRVAAARGRVAGFAAALGITSGVLVWAVAAALGVSALLAASTTAFTALKLAGAAYMIWLGGRLLSAAVRGGAGHPERAPVTAGGAWSCYRQGLLVNLLNPKVGAFYVAVLPQFLPPDVPPAPAAAALALVHNVEGLVWFALLILAVDRMRAWLARPRVARALDGLTGAVIVGFGAVLARSRT